MNSRIASRGLVGVDLVAEEGHEVGPLRPRRGARASARVRRASTPLLCVGPPRRAARSCGTSRRAAGWARVAVDGADARGAGTALSGSAARRARRRCAPCSRQRVARLEAVDDDEGVVVTLDGEGRRRPRPAVGPHGHAASGRGSRPTPWRRSRRRSAAAVPGRGARGSASGTRTVLHGIRRWSRCANPEGRLPSRGTALRCIGVWLGCEAWPQKSMPPISSPPGAIGAAFSGLSAMTASVVRNSAGDRRGVLQRRARHLGRVDDAGGDQVDVLAGRGVEAVTRRRGCAPSRPRRRPRGRR